MEDHQKTIEPQRVRMGTTLKFNNEKAGFLLEGISEGIEPLQQIREVHQNAIDSIQRSGRDDGLIEWGPHPELPQFISCLDNGEGMDESDMLMTLNAGQSGGVQSKKDNFGVGLKVAALMRNPNGVRFEGWKKHVGATSTIWVDRDENDEPTIGFQLHHVDGEESEVLALAEKCPHPDGNGARVTLMGDHENTIEPPEDLPGGYRWILRALNRRYYKPTSGIITRVKFPEGYTTSVTHHGTEKYLNDSEITESNGTVEYKEFKIHWWILKNLTSGERRTSQLWNRNGHIAFLYQDELYGMIDEKHEAGEELRRFGGNGRCVIYIELDNKAKVRADFKRQTVLLNDQEIDLREIQIYFYTHLPQEIRDLVNPANTMSVDDKDYFSDYADKIFKDAKRQKSTIATRNGAHPHDGNNEEETEVEKSNREGTPNIPPKPTTTTGKGKDGTRTAPVAPLPEDLKETKKRGDLYDKKFKYDIIWEDRNSDLLPHYAGFFSRTTRKLHITTDWEPGKKMRDELINKQRNKFAKIWTDEVENKLQSLVNREYAMHVWEKIIYHEQYRRTNDLKTEWSEDAYSPTSVTALFQPTTGTERSMMAVIRDSGYYKKLNNQLKAAKNTPSRASAILYSNN